MTRQLLKRGPRAALLLALMLGSVAYAEPLANVLGRLSDNPSLLAAQAQVQAAGAQVRAAGGIYSVQVKGGYISTTLQDPLPTTNTFQLEAGVSLMPVPFGDNADALKRAQIGLQQAELGLRQARAGLEAQAYSLSASLAVAQSSQQFSAQAAAAAAASLDAARLQAERGLINAAQLRDAEARTREVQEQARTAAESVAQLQAALTDLLGTADVQVTLPPRPTVARSAESVRAEFAVQQAEIALGSAQRDSLPVGNLSYTSNVGDQGSLNLAVNSRTLAPTASYAFITTPRGEAQNQVRSTFSAGVVFNVAPAINDARRAAEASLTAAQASLNAQNRADALQVDVLNTAFDQAGRTLTLRQQAAADAIRSLAEAREREALGLISPLATLSALTDAAQADLALRQARTDQITRLLDFYRFAAQPLTTATRVSVPPMPADSVPTTSAPATPAPTAPPSTP